MDGLIRKHLSILPLEKRVMLDASLPVIAGQVLWLDAADASTIRDADGDYASTGTGGGNNGFNGNVSTWQDKSASGFHVTATTGQTPVYTTNALNGNAVLTFDGGNDRLTRGAASIPGDDFTTFIVFNRTTAAGRDAVAEWGSGGARNALFINEANNGRMNYYINGGWVHYTTPYVAGTNTLASIVHNSNSINLFNNATNQVSTTGTVRTGTNSLYIGDDSSGGDNLGGTIAEILIYDRDLSADERHDVETYLAGKWGLGINNAAPTVPTNTGITLDEGTSIGISSAHLSANDTDNTESRLTYTVTDLADNGMVYRNGVALALNDTFTQQDIIDGFITYTHDGSEGGSDSFSFTVSDGAANAVDTFTFTITPTNDAPAIALNTGATVNEGASVIITAAMLNEADPDDSGTGLTYTASNYMNGHITVGGITQNTFTQADIASGLVAFVHDGSETAGAAFDFSLADGGENGAAPASGTFNLTVTAINDAPIINGWTLVSSEDFEGGAAGWANNTTSNGGIYLTNHLGRFANDGGVQSNSKTYALSSTQEYTVIEFDFYRMDSWDNEEFRIFVDDVQVFTRVFTTGAASVVDGSFGSVSWTVTELTTTTTNFAYSNWTDQKMRFTLTIQNGAASDVKLGFGSTTNQGAADESWGIDNVKIYEARENGTPGPYTLAENTANGQVVGYVAATDAEGDTISYSITGGTGAGAFAINPATGAITVTNSSLLNYEVTTSFTLQISASDDGTPVMSDVETITINLIDVPENNAPTVNAAGPFTVNEDAANNTVVGTITATDPNGDSLTYSISAGNTDSIFSIHATTGVIRVSNNALLDFEHDGQYVLTVVATDNGFGNLTGQRNITINIGDINEAPTFDSVQAVLSSDSTLSYNAATGNFYRYVATTATYAAATANATAQTLFGTAGHIATATTAAENTFIRGRGAGIMWLGGDDSAAEGDWTWQGGGAENGVIFWQGAAAGSVQNGLYANWAAGEPNNSGSTEDFVTLRTDGLWNDVNGGSYAYVIEWEGTDVFAAFPVGPYTIAENSAAATLAGTATAFDIDAGDTLTYSITGGSGAGLFEIDASSGDITVMNGADLNFEATATYTLDLRVEDAAGLFDTRTVTVNLSDANDIPVNMALSNISVIENTSIGTLVGTVSAFDEDTTDILTYTLIDDAGGRFVLAGNSLKTNGAIDFEVASSHSITIRMNDGNGGIVDQLFTIAVTNQADDSVVSPPADPTSTQNAAPTLGQTPISAGDERATLDRLEDQTQTESLLQASLSGEAQQWQAFYGLGGFAQILRENTTFEIRDIEADNSAPSLTPGTTTPSQIVQQDEVTLPQDEYAPLEDQFTNLRDALAFFAQMEQDSTEASDNIDAGTTPDEAAKPYTGPSLDQQFQDVLTYHQRRQDDLRRALMDA